ncbi:MAG: hypothetical protein L3J66_06380 [Bacteroidales bacterium]|nr:hypothetical protein [Bacteroidales bacterium]
MNLAILLGSILIYLALWAIISVFGAKYLKTRAAGTNVRMAMIVVSSIAAGYFFSQTILNPSRNLILLTILFTIGILYNVFKYRKIV